MTGRKSGGVVWMRAGRRASVAHNGATTTVYTLSAVVGLPKTALGMCRCVQACLSDVGVLLGTFGRNAAFPGFA
eukprot:59914-Alexandrium_andersonii.AAC.1